MVQKPILISMIAPVAITGILILAAISSANQSFAYSNYHKTYYKGHHAYYKNSKYTERQGNILTSNTENQAQGATNANTATGASNTGNTAQGASNTGNTAQGASNTGNTAQGASNTGNTAQGAGNGKLQVSNIAGLSPNFAKSLGQPLKGKINDNQLWGADFGTLNEGK
jgi:hypothetical protein